VKQTPLDAAPYAGRWIAILRGRVIATGTSAQDALLNCRALHLKDEPVLRFIPQPRKARPTAHSRKGNARKSA